MTEEFQAIFQHLLSLRCDRPNISPAPEPTKQHTFCVYGQRHSTPMYNASGCGGPGPGPKYLWNPLLK